MSTIPNNLPVQPTSFIGREQEKGEVKRLLGPTRVLTLSGVGGVGKTRLAIQVAAELADAFPDGIWFIALAPLSDPALLPQTIAVVCGLRDEAGRSPLSVLAAHLRDHRVLLVARRVPWAT